MPNNLMFVCEMNVCRSPLMAESFHDALPERLRPQWSISSSGVAAHEGAPMCELAAQLATTRSWLHKASKVSMASLEAADLILVASLRERRALAQMEPGLRDRTFTLREALLLNDAPLLGDEPARGGTLREYASALAARRGMVPVPATRRSLPIIGAGTNPLDVPDVHTMSSRRHRAGLLAAQRNVRELAGRILSRMGLDEAGGAGAPVSGPTGRHGA